MEVMVKACQSSLKALVEWSQRGWRKERPPVQNSSKPLSIPELPSTQTWILGDASYTTLQIAGKDVPWARHTGGPEYGLFKATRIPPTSLPQLRRNGLRFGLPVRSDCHNCEPIGTIRVL